MENDLRKRLFNFAVDTIKFCRNLQKNKEHDVIQYQLLKSATSSGANYEEAQSASSPADFKHKISISLREMRESNYWLRIMKEINTENDNLNKLIEESNELMKILGAISSKLSKNKN